MNPRMQSSDPDEPHDQSKNRGGGKRNEIAQINYNYEPNQPKPSNFFAITTEITIRKLTIQTLLHKTTENSNPKMQNSNPNLKT